VVGRLLRLVTREMFIGLTLVEIGRMFIRQIRIGVGTMGGSLSRR